MSEDRCQITDIRGQKRDINRRMYCPQIALPYAPCPTPIITDQSFSPSQFSPSQLLNFSASWLVPYPALDKPLHQTPHQQVPSICQHKQHEFKGQ